MLLFWSTIALALTPPKPALPQTNGVVQLDGSEVSVHWDDGDTFMVPSTKTKARLSGYNTLESYGPVHRFGPGEIALFGIAAEATQLAKSKVWICTTQEGSGGYGRKSVDCPDLRQAMLERGLAHVFGVSESPATADIEAQAVGIGNLTGMWAKGAPKYIVTSVHSVDEKPGQTETYNRVLDVKTGMTEKRMHSKTYQTCEWVCLDDACLLYVPYTKRYGPSRAACLDPKP